MLDASLSIDPSRRRERERAKETRERGRRKGEGTIGNRKSGGRERTMGRSLEERWEDNKVKDV